MKKEQKLIDILKQFINPPSKVILTGQDLTIAEVIAVAKYGATVEFTSDNKILGNIQKSYRKMIEDVENGIPVYGCNTGYGAQAYNVLINGNKSERIKMAKKISESITHVDVSVGPEFSDDFVRAAMLIRINMLMKGASAVRLNDLDIYRKMLNAHITPIVNKYGGIGASGDLAHNCRILNAARGVRGIKVRDKNGKVFESSSVLKKNKINPLLLEPKAGLAFVNGDNFSSAVASIEYLETLTLLIVSIIVSSVTIEVLKGTNRAFHPLLSGVRPHSGQDQVAQIVRSLLDGSKLAYQEMQKHEKREAGVVIQDGYSLRALSQFHGVNFEKLLSIYNTITININSASDNPLWVLETYTTKKESALNWVSGGNFLAMHMAEAIDGMRKTLTQIVKLSDRHIARLVNANLSNGLPPNLSDECAISRCAFKGVQIQSGMFDVYSSLLSIPVTTFFGVHEEGNQDITSHALTSGIIAEENITLARYALAQQLLAVSQAVDLRGGDKLLSPKTRKVYKFVRSKTQYVFEERPLFTDIETISNLLKTNSDMKVLFQLLLK